MSSKRCVDVVRPRIRPNVELVVDIEPEVQSLFVGDPTRIQQILTNLMSNAAKFTHAGEIVLRIRQAGGPNKLHFSVADTGIGIEKLQLDKIFEDFVQADSSVTREYGGTGLGPGIVKRLIDLMGGKATVESAVGKGTVFGFSMELQVSARPAGEPKQLAGEFGGRRALIVVGVATNRLVFSKWLGAWGFDCADAPGLPEALRLLQRPQEPHYDLVILDSRLNGVSCLDAVSKILELSPKSAAIMLMSEDVSAEATKAQSRGLAGFAHKPVSRRELLRMVNTALHRDTMRQAAAAPAVAPRVAPAEESPRNTASTKPRLLIAEDNRILLDAYLKGRAQIQFAKDGNEAVERFARDEYDLVLMDIQMPVKDGLVATREIREMEERLRRERTPILAFSANAFRHDIEASLSAGCDAHLSKPITKQALLGAIEEHRKPPSGATAVTPVAPELGVGYLERRRKELVQLKTLLKQGRYDEIRVLGHNMKAAASGYSFFELGEVGKSIERNAESLDADALGDDIRRVGEYLERTRGASPASKNAPDYKSATSIDR